ncbi:hypothetical protein RhiirB3_444434 [Rhizophagus irregularis]|nr:hypothetical protein RhiirB3_444434 [Rhizophagus irregularis]
MEYNQVIANIWEFCCEKVITRIWIKRCEIVAEIDKERGVNKKDLKKRKQMDRDERDENKEVKNNKNRKTNDDDKNQKNLEKKIKLKFSFRLNLVIENIMIIPDDSDSSESENDVYDMNVSPLRRLLLNILNFGLINKAFLFAKEGLKKYNLGEENRQLPIKNNLNDMIFITTLFNEHFGHNLDTSASHFEASKAFTKPMLNDIECINQRLYYVSRSIKFRTIQIKPNRDDHQITNGLEIDQENVGQIGNPIIRRPKGRPPGTARFKRPLEASNEGNKSRKCGLCNESGHNRTTCPVNTNRRKERMMIR